LRRLQRCLERAELLRVCELDVGVDQACLLRLLRGERDLAVVRQDLGVDVVRLGAAGLGGDDLAHHRLGLRVAALLDFGFDVLQAGQGPGHGGETRQDQAQDPLLHSLLR
jgi:hypothetical protein